MERQEVDKDCIEFLIKHHYIKNFSPECLLADFRYQIPLSQFICYCVGIVNCKKAVHCLRIIQKTPSEKITTMSIEWILFHNEEQRTIQFWVSSGVSLKRNFFCHEDQLNFFRSTFIFYPELGRYYRLSNILNFISLQEINPMGESVYTTHLKYHHYKKRIDIVEGGNTRKRKKEFKKAIKKLTLKFNVDGYIEKYHPTFYKQVTFIQNDNL